MKQKMLKLEFQQVLLEKKPKNQQNRDYVTSIIYIKLRSNKQI